MMRISRAWIWVILILSAFLLLSSNVGGKQPWNSVERSLIEVFAPVQRLLKESVQAVEEVWLNYFYLVGLRAENRELKEKVNALRLEKRRYQELLAAQDRIKALLKYRRTLNRPTMAARVVGRDPTRWFRSIVIDKGKEAGVKENMPVINASGLVGRVVSSSSDFAEVLLIIDQNSAVDSLIQRSRERGILKGVAIDRCTLEYMVKSSDVAVGDKVITSGLGGVFPKGLAVGSVSSVNEVPGELFKDVEVRPAVDFSKLEEVLVILKEKEKKVSNH